MNSHINLKNIMPEQLKHTDLDRVDVHCSPPDFEPQRQYYFMAKCRQYVKEESERVGHILTASVITFGCQMNARDSEKLEGILKNAGYVEEPDEKKADFVIFNFPAAVLFFLVPRAGVSSSRIKSRIFT